MKNNKNFSNFLLIVIIIIASICYSCKNEDNYDNNYLTEISKWVYDWMYDLYLWYDKMPIIVDFSTKTEPEKFFYEELIYKTEDKWSYITNNFAELESELVKGTPKSMGFYPIFARYGENKVVIIIAYVYSNSPAAKAGLKRGDIIFKINGQFLTIYNYYDLYNQESYTITLGKYDENNKFQEIKTIQLNAEIIEANPVLFDTTYNFNNQKTGYLVYVQFINGEKNKYKDILSNAINKFKNNNIQNLIVDLRYNPGGEIENATFLGSSLAPANVARNNEIFIKLNYNNKLQQYFLDEEGSESDNLIIKFDTTVNNLNINKIYFLTTNQTASASELLIIGLKSYFKDNLKIVGSNTYGKYVGSLIIYDFENNPRKHNWAIMPVVLKYSNADDYTDFKDGLTPDIEITENLLDLKNFGDTLDPFLHYCLNDIRNIETLQQKNKIDKKYHILDNPLFRIKSNLIVKKFKK